MISEELVTAILSRLGQLDSLPLKEAEVRLAEELGFDDVELLDSSQRPIHGRTLFKKAIETAASAQVTVPLRRGEPVRSYDNLNEPVPPHLIRAMERAEQNGPIWAGYLINTLVPQLGYGPSDARDMLRKMEAEGIVTIFKQPNPRSPDRPTTYVRLNRENRIVHAALRATGNVSPPGFRPIKIRGGPISDDIIRDRR